MMHSSLSKVVRFFELLNISNINYFLWKGSTDLCRGLIGDGDLDLYLMESDLVKFDLCVKKFSLFKTTTNSSRSHEGIHDYFLFDDETGSLIHLQIYTKLVFGAKSISLDYNFEFKNTCLLMNNRICHPEYPVYVLPKSIEDAFLYARLAILAYKNKLKFQLEPHFVPDVNVFKSLESIEFSRDIIASFEGISEDSYYVSLKDIGNKICKNPVLIGCSKQNQLPLIIKTAIAKLLQAFKLLNMFPINFHRNLTSGKAIVFIGADGSGKSTQVERLSKLLSTKLNVKYLYMGSGKNETDIFVNFIKLVRKLLGANKSSNNLPQNKKVDNKQKISSSNYLTAVYSFFLARSKRKKIILMNKFHKAGYLLIIDRFPQNQIKGSNDGPLLSNFIQSKSKFLSMIAIYEEKIYSAIVFHEISALVIKFETEDLPKVFERRKDEMTYSNFCMRHQENNALSFHGKNLILTKIDPCKSLPTVNKLVDKQVTNYLGL